ncbi:MAG: NCS2 family permease, partial [Verrucomicrobiae bacterium]|nr:NCS2 family permease [Verrucomicrobiae bacterium]
LTSTLWILSEVVPIEAGMAILIWIGFTISSQAFQVVPKSHAPAVIAGLIPGMGAFVALIVKRVLGAVGYGTADQPYTHDLLITLARDGSLFAKGIFALEQGWLYASVVLASITVAIVEKRFAGIVGWLIGAGILSFLGIIHHFRVLDTDVTTALGPAWPWIIGYTVSLIALVVVRYTLVLGHHDSDSHKDK